MPVPGSGSGARGWVQHEAGPIGTVTVASRARGEETWKVTQAGPVTMTPPVKPVKRGPHTGSRTVFREAARRAWRDRVLNNSPMRDGEPYTSLALAGRVTETVAKGAADAATARISEELAARLENPIYNGSELASNWPYFSEDKSCESC